MTWALMFGAGVGLGVLLLGWAVVPPRTDLVAAVGRWETQRAHKPPTNVDQTRSWRDRLGATLAAELRQRGVNLARRRTDLALVGRTLEDHLSAMALLAAFGLLLPAAFTAVLYAGGVNLGWKVPAIVGLILAALFMMVPDLALAQAARAKRAELRRALSCYLDLVAMSLAGGRGIPEALPSAAKIGRGWAFELIADTISRARYAGTTPWGALADLGEQVDLPELRDLGGALTLVADDGAKVRPRAATQRRRQLAEAAGEAEKGDQTIQLAQVVLAAGFLLFLCYPAVVNVLVL